MTLVSKCYAILRQSSFQRSFWVVVSIYTLIGILPTYYLDGVNNDDPDLAMKAIKAYVISKIVIQFLNYFYDQYVIKLTLDLQKIFEKDAYHKYDSMSFQSKTLEQASDFQRKMKNASWIISNMIDWGVPTLIRLMTSILGAIWIFYNQGLLKLLCLILFANFVIYWTIIRKLQHKYTKLRSKKRNEHDQLWSLITAKLPWLETGAIDPDKLVGMESEIISGQTEIHLMWQKISFVTNFFNVMPLIWFLFYDEIDSGYFLLITSVFENFTSSLSSLMNFMNQYTSYQMKYELFEDIWKDKEFKATPLKFKMPYTIHVLGNQVKRGKFIMNIPRMQITLGDKILIKGRSGHGKSTWIEALLGKMKGVTLKNGEKPENYYHQVAEFYQNIKEKMPTKTITIRQLFDDEQDNDLIQHCLEIACAWNWAQKLEPHKEKEPIKMMTFTDVVNVVKKHLFGWKSKPIKELDLEIGIEKSKPHIFDRKIFEKHSGGEKTRLALATRIHQMIKNDAKWLVLDEPEQGSDPEVAYQIVQNILNEFQGTTLIVISHLEFIQNKFEWTQKYTVHEGMVSVMN